MTSFVSSNQDIPAKKSISLNYWVALFVSLQILLPMCDYVLKQIGASSEFTPLYTKIASSILLVFISISLLIRHGVIFSERLAEYKRNAGRDLVASLIIAGAGVLLAILMGHFGLSGRVYSVNSSVLGNLFVGPDGGISQAGLILVALSYCLLVPVMEELFFRRLLYVALRKKFSLFRSLLINSMLFGLIHPEAVFFSVLFALAQCLAYERYGRVSINIMSHIAFNSAIIGLSFLSR